VNSRVQALREAEPLTIFNSAAFEKEPKEEPTRLALRLGNRSYSHMKLVIERSPDGRGHLFRADTHDRHILPSVGSRDYEPFRALMEQNRRIAAAIETEWESRGLATFKQYLREDLARRRAGKTK
jgi:hypothetical protein